jgi:hypothetical protein
LRLWQSLQSRISKHNSVINTNTFVLIYTIMCMHNQTREIALLDVTSFSWLPPPLRGHHCVA